VGIGGFGDKAQDALGNEKVTDQALDTGEDFADDKTGGRYDEQTDKAGDLADKRLGDEGGSAG
jgi:hypothetical protein